MWANCDIYDIERDLLNGIGPVEIPDINHLNHDLLLYVLSFVKDKYSSFVFVPVSVDFGKDTFAVIRNALITNGYVFTSSNDMQSWKYLDYSVIGFARNNVSDVLVDAMVKCSRRYSCSSETETLITKTETDCIERNNYKKFSDFGLSIGNSDQKHFCKLLLRDELLYSLLLPPVVDGNGILSSGKKKVAFGIPTLSHSSLNSPTDISLFKHLLPSLIRSLTDDELKNYDFVLYIGFDEEDRFFDNADSFNIILNRFKELVGSRTIQMVALKFPFTKGWVTYLWNSLFVKAVQDGCTYFYQINDDIIINSSGWLSDFVSTLNDNSNIGVVGPKDPLHGDRVMLTQSFVHRTHYEIFGRLYPSDIKDWYSDDWMSEVYGPSFTKTFPQHTINNVNDKGTRYTACVRLDWKPYVESGKKILAEWKENLLKNRQVSVT
ncbi:hypothetical protein ROZALSC1DRAFT_28771 [Rozella allomycis CSF55]|uniref:Uncharacterized protein n=1 Tax=Rozella allomycis (strain CSF55) TaxID=988480 RepID=A0A075ANH4_ROZAC|nr:hypothetical protein O9G_003142 [Rozella allomycis CSF55]RKP19655.1 hypothetical protein ROZALSC1DRAFT_28771 [Rozella allomycis CSF55]|eukprot:EPZ31420.1 hypothetical protein O9G_003142 [Rozella allomycis CSF55]